MLYEKLYFNTNFDRPVPKWIDKMKCILRMNELNQSKLLLTICDRPFFPEKKHLTLVKIYPNKVLVLKCVRDGSKFMGAHGVRFSSNKQSSIL